MKNWSITEIENITEDQAKEMSIDTTEIKGHNVYFVDFEGGFGFSCLVFKNNHHIHYANDYQLHHSKEDTKEELKQMYIEGLNNKLFTEAEIVEPLKDYDDYKRRSYFLHNYYGMQVDYISGFQIVTREEDRIAFQKKVKDMIYNPVGFSYMSDADFVKRHVELLETLEKVKTETVNNYEYYKNAFLYEMYNHEYGINWQADYDTLSAFGNVKYHDGDLNAYFEELHFNETQRRAYVDARSQYFAETEDEY